MKPETLKSCLKQAAKYLEENGCRDVIIAADESNGHTACIINCKAGVQGMKLSAWIMDEFMDDFVNERSDLYNTWIRAKFHLLNEIEKMEKKYGVFGPDPFASPFPKD